MPILGYIIVAVAAYLLGSIPTGFLVARAKGIDIRTVGSGNIGATNAMRVLGQTGGNFCAADGCGERLCRLRLACGNLFCNGDTAIFLTDLINCRRIRVCKYYLGGNFRRARPQLHLLAQIQRRQGHRHQRRGLSGAGAVAAVDRRWWFSSWRVLVTQIRFGRFHLGGDCAARRGLGADAAQFISRHRHDGAGRAGDLQTQIQHSTPHGRNRKPAAVKKKETT